MRHFFHALLFCLSVACGSDEPSPAADAPPVIDAPPAVDAAIDAAPLPACTGAAYDPCTDNAQCMSDQCRAFGGAGIQVCTVNCDAQNPCPTFNGAAVQCNNMGRCNPGGENMCMR